MLWRLVSSILLLSLTSLPPPSRAYDALGQWLIASIAARYLNDSGTTLVSFLLPDADTSLTDPSVYRWADTVVNDTQWQWTAPYHSASIAERACDFNASRDCPRGDCLPFAVANYSRQLADSSVGDDAQLTALRFTVNLMANLHQPLAIGYASDHRGVDDKGEFFGSETNLHEIYRSSMLQQLVAWLYPFATSQNGSEEYRDRLFGIVDHASANVSEWLHCNDSALSLCPDEWASETAYIVCSAVYYSDSNSQPINASRPFDLGFEYLIEHFGAVELSIMKAGIRLAHVTNSQGYKWYLGIQPQQGYFVIVLTSVLVTGTAIFVVLAFILREWRHRVARRMLSDGEDDGDVRDEKDRSTSVHRSHEYQAMDAA